MRHLNKSVASLPCQCTVMSLDGCACIQHHCLSSCSIHATLVKYYLGFTPLFSSNVEAGRHLPRAHVRLLMKIGLV